MKDVLAQIARTAALCGSLGVALYCVLMGIAEIPGFAPIFAVILGIVAMIALVALSGTTLWDALRSGVFPVMPLPAVQRDRQPISFWFMMAWTLLCALAGLALIVYVVFRPAEP